MSNVPKSKRTESPLEFYVQALRLRDTITTLMFHDFGAKKKIREGKEVVFNNISGDDRKTILEILEREGSNPVTVERFPFLMHIDELLKLFLVVIILTGAHV